MWGLCCLVIGKLPQIIGAIGRLAQISFFVGKYPFPKSRNQIDPGIQINRCSTTPWLLLNIRENGPMGFKMNNNYNYIQPIFIILLPIILLPSSNSCIRHFPLPAVLTGCHRRHHQLNRALLSPEPITLGFDMVWPIPKQANDIPSGYLT